MNDFRSPDASDASDALFASQTIKSPKSFNPNRAPGWLKRPATVSFGFGGKLVSVPVQTPGSASPVQIYSVATDEDLVSRSREFQNALKGGKIEEYCEKKASSVQGDEKYVWNILKVQNNRRS